MFLTTHYMDEAENLADRIAVIAAGQIVAEGTPGTLGGRERMAATIRFTLPAGDGLGELPDGLARLAEPGRRRSRAASAPRRRSSRCATLADWALGAASSCPTSTSRRPTLEDVYLAADRRGT